VYIGGVNILLLAHLIRSVLRLPQNLNNSLTGTTVCIKESVKYLWQTHQGLCGDSGSATYLIIVAVHLMLRDFFYTLFGHLHIELCSE
jgi:hypothetical protein